MITIRVLLGILTQVPILYFVAGAKDLLWGFNQTDAGFMLLILLFLLVPLLNMGWVGLETWRAARQGGASNRTMAILPPVIAMFFFLESLAIDVYLLSQARM